MSRIEYCSYGLTSRRRLSAHRAEGTTRGALVRAEGGVACLQTWPELGDPPLEDVLDDFRGECQHPISRQAWACCRVDGVARRAGSHLLAGLSVPESHYTLPWGETGVPEGFRTVKVKAGPDLNELRRVLRGLRPDLRIRLDFNETLDVEPFRRAWLALEPFHARIDFVEDPVPYRLEVWLELERELGCRLAVDRSEEESPFLRVWKPARRDWKGTGEVVVTSNMDHPIGQVFAAYCAAKLNPRARLTGCGLVTHHLFDPADPFVASMGPARPEFPRAVGTGLGFDGLLEQLPWRTW